LFVWQIVTITVSEIETDGQNGHWTVTTAVYHSIKHSTAYQSLQV